VRLDRAIHRANMRDQLPAEAVSKTNGLSCGRCPPLQSIPPTPCESRWRNKPSEVSFDSRRGATLETFSSRNGHSGPGARDGRSSVAEQASSARGKPLCGLPLSPTIGAAVTVVPRSGSSERKSFGPRASDRAESCRRPGITDYTRYSRGGFTCQPRVRTQLTCLHDRIHECADARNRNSHSVARR
jgi:hypothetical protein